MACQRSHASVSARFGKEALREAAVVKERLVHGGPAAEIPHGEDLFHRGESAPHPLPDLGTGGPEALPGADRLRLLREQPAARASAALRVPLQSTICSNTATGPSMRMLSSATMKGALRSPVRLARFASFSSFSSTAPWSRFKEHIPGLTRILGEVLDVPIDPLHGILGLLLVAPVGLIDPQRPRKSQRAPTEVGGWPSPP